MLSYIAISLIVAAALYLAWDYLAKRISEAVDFHNQNNGVTPAPPMPEPVELKPTRIDALRKAEWLRTFYADNGMDDSLRKVNEAAAAMFADDPKGPPSE